MTKEKFSKKRVAILETLRATKVHPTAEWVYNELKPIYTDISLGTIYRNIKKFCESGEVKSVGVYDGQEHFDANLEPHYHFVCNKCRAILDVEGTFLSDSQKDELGLKYNFNISDEEIIFRGCCKNCM